MWTGCIAFRVGTDEFGAKPPSQFPYRFAVLTWLDRGGDGADPWSLLRECVPIIAQTVRADTVIAEYWTREKRLFCRWADIKVRECRWEELMQVNDEELHDNGEFPSKLRFENQHQAVLLAESEMWSSIGGPHPYHDSVTLSIFSAEDLSGQLERIFTEAALRQNLEITDPWSRL